MIYDIARLFQLGSFELGVEEEIEHHGHNHHYAGQYDSAQPGHLVLVVVETRSSQPESALANYYLPS